MAKEATVASETTTEATVAPIDPNVPEAKLPPVPPTPAVTTSALTAEATGVINRPDGITVTTF